MKFIKEIIPYIIIIVVVLIIRGFIITPVRVSGSSMENTLFDGDIVFLKKYSKTYNRNDIVVVNYNGEKLIKRIIGLPNETIEYKDNVLYINDTAVSDIITANTYDFSKTLIKDNYYFVMGDNRDNSLDSRIIGIISEDDIVGKVDFLVYPFNRFGKIKAASK